MALSAPALAAAIICSIIFGIIYLQKCLLIWAHFLNGSRPDWLQRRSMLWYGLLTLAIPGAAVDFVLVIAATAFALAFQSGCSTSMFQDLWCICGAAFCLCCDSEYRNERDAIRLEGIERDLPSTCADGGRSRSPYAKMKGMVRVKRADSDLEAGKQYRSQTPQSAHTAQQEASAAPARSVSPGGMTVPERAKLPAPNDYDDDAKTVVG